MILAVILVAPQKKEDKERSNENKLESRRNLNNRCKKPNKKKQKIQKQKHHLFCKHLLLQMQLKQLLLNLCSNLTKKPQLLCLSQSLGLLRDQDNHNLLRNQDNHRESMQSKSPCHNRCNGMKYLTLCQTIVQIRILHPMRDEKRQLKYNKTQIRKKRRNKSLSDGQHHCPNQQLLRCGQVRL